MAEQATTFDASQVVSGTLPLARGGTAATTAAGARTSLGLAIGTDVQGYSVNLTTYGSITPSANVQTLLGAASYSAFRTSLGLVISTDVQAYNANLTTYAGIAPAANVQSLLGAANYSAMRTLLSLVPGTDVLAPNGSGASLTSLNASNISSGTLAAARGGAGTVSGLLKGDGAGVVSAAAAGSDYVGYGGALGTPSSGTLTSCTGLPVSTGISGLGTGVATFLATPSSANLLAALTTKTGTGSAVFATSPTFDTTLTLQSSSVNQFTVSAAGLGCLRFGAALGQSVGAEFYTTDATAMTRTVANRSTIVGDVVSGLRLASGYGVVWSSNAAGSGDCFQSADTYATRSSAANVLLGTASAGFKIGTGGLFPTTDGTYGLGDATHRIASLFATGATFDGGAGKATVDLLGTGGGDFRISQGTTVGAGYVSLTYTSPKLGLTRGGTHFLWYDTATGDVILNNTFGGSSVLGLAYGGTKYWQMPSTGHFLATTDNANDIGASGATRPRTGYFGTSLNVANGTITINGASLSGNSTTDNFLNITGTLPTTMTQEANAINVQITGAGTSAQVSRAMMMELRAGYTGSSQTQALSFNNYSLGTNTTFGNAGATGGNIGIVGAARGSSASILNIGCFIWAGNGISNYAIVGDASFQQRNNASAVGVGVTGMATRANASALQVGGYFTLGSSAPNVSAALLADNSTQTSDIFVARDNSTAVFKIIDGGLVTFGDATSSFPAIKRSSAILQARLADDSGYAAFESETAKVHVGTTTSSMAKVGGMLPGLPNVTAVGNVGAGEDDLMSYTIPANTFAANGDTVKFSAVFAPAPSGTVKEYFAGNRLVADGGLFIYDDDVAVPVNYEIVRLTSSTAMFSALGGSATNGMRLTSTVITGLDFTSALIFKHTGEGGTSTTNEVVQKTLLGWYYPAN